MTDSYHDTLMDLIDCLSTIEAFPGVSYTDRIFNKAICLERAITFAQEKEITSILPNYPPDDPNPDATVLDGQTDVADFLNRIVDSSFGECLFIIKDDTKGYKNYVNQQHAHDATMKTLATLCSFTYAEHISRHLKTNKRADLHTLQQDSDFCTYVANNLQDPDFIRTNYYLDKFQQNHLTSMATVYMAGYLGMSPDMGPLVDEMFDGSVVYSVLGAISRAFWDEYGAANPDKLKDAAIICGKSATPVYSPPVQSPTPLEVTQHLYGLLLKSSANDAYADAMKQRVKELANGDFQQWQDNLTTLHAAWTSTAFQKFENALSLGLSNSDDPVGSWIQNGYQYEQNNNIPPAEQIFTGSPPTPKMTRVSLPLLSGSYILAGMQLPTADKGLRRIEDLVQGDKVLTLAQTPAQYATVSSLTHLKGFVSVIAFNEELPFAVAEQVFHTTTGLRAVDHETAMRQNPWAKIGPLKVGHVLYRLRNDQSGYDTVEVESIDRSEPMMQDAYDLQLSNGVRLHHVNQYLGNLNYPEVTVQSVAKLIQKVPAGDRFKLLSTIPELRPLIDRFGGRTICQRLDKELSESRSTEPAWSDVFNFSFSKRKHPPTPCRPLDNLVRTFRLVLSDETQPLPSQYQLPSVTLVEGILNLDNAVQPLSNVDADKRTVRWSRKMEDIDRWEHGWLRIGRSGGIGSGVVLLSPERSPNDFSSGEVFRFHLRSDNSTNQGALDEPIVSTSGDVWSADDYFDVVYDPQSTKLKGLKVQTGAWVTPEGVEVAAMRVPYLDDLQSAITKKFGTTASSEPLYTTETYNYTVKDSEGKPYTYYRYKVDVNKAALLPYLSDAGYEGTSALDVSFQKVLGVDTKLPILCESFYMDFNADFDVGNGGIFEYNRNMRGVRGDKHGLQATYAPSPTPLGMWRKFASHAFAAFATPGVPTTEDPQLQPASITESLSSQDEPTLDGLVNLANYDPNQIHSLAQSTIQNMMYYHMDDDQRKNFTNQSKPQNLPPNLTDQLDQKLKDFFKNTFAPAFICRSLLSIDQYKQKFNTTQQNRIWYWWRGNGKTCLSQQKEYTEINSLAAAYAVQTLYSDTLSLYQPKSDYWIKQITQLCQRNTFMRHLFINSSQEGENELNRLCTIIHALDPSSKAPDALFKRAVAWALRHGIHSNYIGDNTPADAWLDDALHTFIVAVLSNDPKLNKSVQQKLMQDLVNFEKANNLDMTKSAEERAKDILQKQLQLQSQIGTWLSQIVGGAMAIFRGTRLFQWAGAVYDNAVDTITQVGKSIPGVQYLKGLHTICMVSVPGDSVIIEANRGRFKAGVYLAFAATGILSIVKDWDNMSPGDKATAILEILSIVVAAVGQAADAWETYTTDSKGDVPEQLAADTLNDRVDDAVGNSGDTLDEVAQIQNGPDGLQVAVANRLTEAGQPPPAGDGNDDVNSFNKGLGDIDPDVTLKDGDLLKDFSMQGHWLRGLNAFIGVGVTIAMAFSLAQNWDNLSDAGKIIDTMAVIIQGLTVLLDVVDIAETLGFIVIGETLAVALPIIGAVLAVLGIILMIISFFVQTETQQSPPDPVQQFIDNVATQLIASWLDLPNAQLSYAAAPSQLTSGSQTTITVTATNNTGSAVSIQKTDLTLYTGEDPSAIYSTADFQLVLDTDTHKSDPGHVCVSPDAAVIGDLTKTTLGSQTPYYSYDLLITSDQTATKSVSITLKPGDSFQAVWTGIVKTVKTSQKWFIDVAETAMNRDMSLVQLVVECS